MSNERRLSLLLSNRCINRFERNSILVVFDHQSMICTLHAKSIIED